MKLTIAKTAIAASLLASLAACASYEGGESASARAQSTIATSTLRIQNGLIKGVPGALDGVTVFKGVPFAAPPVGRRAQCR